MSLPSRNLPLPVMKALKCTQCGAPIELRGGPRSAVVVCAYCGSAMDTRDPNYAVLWQQQQAVKFEPLIPLGKRGSLRGEKLECIGYMRRAQTVDGIDYHWSEYLLFNPFKGYRWLTEYNGHWTLMRECMALPVAPPGPVAHDPPTGFGLKYEGHNFKHFASYMARVTYVLGEFYWAVEMGQQSMLADYVDPPYALSAEMNQDNEMVWSVGEYLSGREVFDAFEVIALAPAAIGVGPNQPSPIGDIGKLWTNYALFVSLAFLITLMFMMFSSDKVVLQQGFPYGENQKERSVVSNYFDLDGRTSNVIVEMNAGLDNRWLSVPATLINDTTNDAIDFWLDTQHYAGVDDGENWSEGDGRANVAVPQVPAGHYYLRLDAESGRNEKPDAYDPNKPDPGNTVFTYNITVTRDHTRWTFFWWILFLLLPLPCIQGLRSSSFENRRWLESDHPRVAVTSS